MVSTSSPLQVTFFEISCPSLNSLGPGLSTCKPADIEWKLISQKGDEKPSARSGHSLNWIGLQNYLLFGGIEDSKSGKIEPSSDLWNMKLGSNDCNWNRIPTPAGDKPLARTQHIAVSIQNADKVERVFIFGGHHSPQSRLNDTWFYEVKTNVWRRVGSEKDNTENLESTIGAPSPRANSSAVLYEGKIYVFGGHGGLSYSRVAFNDLYAFDLETETWELIKPTNSSPEGRGGHSTFASEGKIFVYGGWNSEMQFNNVWQFDLEKKEWYDPDCMHEVHRWNQSSFLVPAIPTWKFFIFGGEQAEYQEGTARAFGQYVNTSAILDLGTMRWTTFASDPATFSNIPSPREYCAMSYDGRERRLVIFGGWNNGWYDDLYTLNVSKIVGPPYAIVNSDPAMGQLSGGVELEITGRGFSENQITVLFTQGDKPVDAVGKMTKQVPGTFKDATTITCVTPNFDDFGPKQCIMQLQIGTQDITTTWVPFQYFLDTKASKSLVYGPGILHDNLVSHETEFVIVARNELNENRTSGRDKYIVKLKTEAPKPEDYDEEANGPYRVKYDSIDVPVEDNHDGTYKVKYTFDEEKEVEVHVYLMVKEEQVAIRGSPYKASFNSTAKPADNTLAGPLMQSHFKQQMSDLMDYMTKKDKSIATKGKDLQQVPVLLGVKEEVEDVFKNEGITTLKIDQLDESIKMFGAAVPKVKVDSSKFGKIVTNWNNVKNNSKNTQKQIKPIVAEQDTVNKNNVKVLEEQIGTFTMEMRKRPFFKYETGASQSITLLGGVFDELKEFENQRDTLGENSRKFGNPDLIIKCQKDIEAIKTTVDNMKALWDHIETCQQAFTRFMNNKWIETEPFVMEDEVKKLQKTLKEMKVDKKANAYNGILDETKKWLVFLPLIAELAEKAMRDRHWDMVMDKVGVKFVIDENLLLRDIYNLNLGKYQEDVEEITDQAKQEEKMEKTLKKIEENWKDTEFIFQPHKDSGVQMMRLSEENFDMLEENQVQITAMSSSKYLATFETKINYWNKSLGNIDEVYRVVGEVFRLWSFLENLFIHSDEVKKELPKESTAFVGIDKEVRDIFADGLAKKKAITFCTQEKVLPRLEEVGNQLGVCEKALHEFMEGKRIAFPRFYFVSTQDLLDILSNGNAPAKVMVHMTKIISAVDTLDLLEEGVRPFAKGIQSAVGKESFLFKNECKLLGKVENYMQSILDEMRASLKQISQESQKKYAEIDKETWIRSDPAMVTLLINNCQWVINCESAFAKCPTDKDAVKKAYEHQVNELQALIMMAQGDLDKPLRTKVMCLITMDAHSRDIIDKLVQLNVTRVDDFNWQTQLKGVRDPGRNDFVFKICDAVLQYGYEYLGNGPRLVITPLTDRIYVTATQALHLMMGCAPAGPAGTGKTESTKDLAAALGKACYVFNCSDQMDYQGMAGIFKGLAASGSWGCFDEFNRLIPPVLSVCSVQFKSVTDAIKAGKTRFNLQGDEIALDPSCGAFITMNPGYLGRSELPEGLKALFRPITVVVPDLELICENMLMAEGFVLAKALAKKFTTLYFLCRDLLSKAAHYDWGLRAIKSVLVVAGQMKRAEPELQEGAVLLRALRDFNTPKIVADDFDIFMGLLGDLFPGIDVPRTRDMRFEGLIEQVVAEADLNADPDFILKIVQLGELMEIRHCTFVMGPPGAGKSSTWKMLAKANDKDGRKTTVDDINPKVTSTNELYGVVLLATREWKDGLLSKKLRDLGQINDTNPKWLILDGDLDANWIESMNSVMDDNKLLTLASNERIPLKAHMKMIFEIRDLRFATPATVSRAGILFISDTSGSQWKSYVISWIRKMKYDDERKKGLKELFDKYVEKTLFYCKKTFKHVVPQQDICMVMGMCKLLENMLATNEVKTLDIVFTFVCIWCIGGGYATKDGVQYKEMFSNWWKTEFKAPKFPSKGTVFDYYMDLEANKPEDWSKLSDSDIISTIDTSKSIQSYTIPTVETISASFLMNQFINIKHCCILVGMPGTGKTQIIKGLLNDLCAKDPNYLQQIINFNFYTDANALQLMLEQNLEKKAGKMFAPKGTSKLIYFVDDLNMPARDPYDTQNAIALLRQHRDYEHWYDKNKLLMKEIKNTQLIAAMNPTAGSFFVNPRLQRHFWLLAVGMPDQASLSVIYQAYLARHFASFKGAIQAEIQPIIKATLSLHSEVDRQFKKTAQNFHYQFNCRHLTNVFQGILAAKKESIKEPDNLVRLWVHEAERIYGDRLVNAEHLGIYKGMSSELCSKSFSKYNMKKYFGASPEPLVFASFVNGLDEKLYDQFPNADIMSQRLLEALREYNDVNAVMDLVLFEDAMKHVCKISRIIGSDQGHALLVGVGGSGKQSLSKLSSFINFGSGCTVSIMISSTYGLNDLKADQQAYYLKSGVKDEGLMFLFTEGQITNERFLVSINDLLSSGEIADLFSAEDEDGIINNVRPACKSEGLGDANDVCMKFFMDRVRKNLHMSICFSPVGDAFRNRAKKFPALVNSTVIDWFYAWPEDALLSVAAKFLADVEMDTPEIREGIETFMPYSYRIVNDMSATILAQEKRYVYTTPKSFLELIALFKKMFGTVYGRVSDDKDKYETGVIKLTETGEVVSKLEEELKIFSVEVEEKKKKADATAEIVGVEKAKVEIENAAAAEEAAKCAVIKTTVEAKLKSVQADLDMALPLVEKAKKSLEGITIQHFRDLKALKSPPKDIEKTFTAALHLLCKHNPDVPTDKNGKLKTENPWKTALGLMGNPQKFLDNLLEFKQAVDEDKVPPKNFAAIRDTIADETFTPEFIMKASPAASMLCDWILNITAYYDVVVSVEPKKQEVADAQAKLAAANAKKEEVDIKCAELNAALAILMADYNEAMDTKNQAIAESERCERKLNLAQRLVAALGSEQEKWAQSIIDLGEYLQLVIGDVLLASAFVSYVGPFNKTFRDRIMNDNFVQFFKKNNIPLSEAANPVAVLSDEATIAGWNNYGLPPDRVSTENGAILNNSDRWSLIIDPQLQGITWLRKTWEKHDLAVTRLSNPKMVRTIEQSVEVGNPVLIENLENTIDAVIQPVYARNYIKKGKSKYIKMGDKELNLSPQFKLFLHTKLSNPHYAPEIQAECTLINFTVTQAGLEDQLLALVVKKERPDLAAQKEHLIQEQNGFKIKLKELESDILYKIANAQGDILEDIALIESLEFSKKLSIEIGEKVEIAKVTDENINVASEFYRPAGARGALVFFMMMQLTKIHSFYKFSLDSFVIVVKRAIDLVAEADRAKKKAAAGAGDGGEGGAEGEGAEGEGADGDAPAEEAKAEDAPAEVEEVIEEMTPKTLEKRVQDLTESITYQAFNYTRRGTFEQHKLTLATMLTFRILSDKKQLDQKEIDHLVKKEMTADPPHQPDSLNFIPESMWPIVKALEQLKVFEKITDQMESEPHLYKKWYTDEKPEECDLPKTIKDLGLFHRILLLRAVRPDRLSNALSLYVAQEMGLKYVEAPPFDIVSTATEMNPQTPTFFVLFPGVDPTPEVELIGSQAGKTLQNEKFINISMGQGQEQNAIKALKEAGKAGNWVMFQNVHLMTDWMKDFERQFEIVIEEGAHEDFRCFISSEPPGLPHMEIIPESVLQNALKIANEAPKDLKSNIRRAFSKFDETHFVKAQSHKFPEFKALLFGLCMFHALILGRIKFGAQGWSRKYNFNDGDLRICGNVLHNYLASYDQVPYNDLRYLFGEIMYGGHITDNWDRRTNSTYLEVLIKPAILQGMNITLAPGFRSPPQDKFDRTMYENYVTEKLPAEDPRMFGLHPNAEINYLTNLGEDLFFTILSCTGGGGGGGSGGKDAIVKEMIERFLNMLPAEFSMLDLNVKANQKGRSPYVVVCLQECERMNILTGEMKKSLTDLDMGLKGQLNITDDMDQLSDKMFLNMQPDLWVKYAYFSKKPLPTWFDDLLLRIKQLEEYAEELAAPASLWISGLFNPMSYLTSIMQVTARRDNLALDDMTLKTTITNVVNHTEITENAENGAYVHGFFLQGASWELGRGAEQGNLTEMAPKVLMPELPVVHVTAINRRDQVSEGFYDCPVYVTTMRGGTYVFTAKLKMESDEFDAKLWVLAGVAMIMSLDD